MPLSVVLLAEPLPPAAGSDDPRLGGVLAVVLVAVAVVALWRLVVQLILVALVTLLLLGLVVVVGVMPEDRQVPDSPPPSLVDRAHEGGPS